MGIHRVTIRFERTADAVLIREIMTHPKIWPWITDDGSPAAADFEPAIHPSLWYVLAFDGEELMGLWLFAAQSSACFEAHTCLLPGQRGERAGEAAKQVIAWIWANTPCRRIFTNVPRFNRAALYFAVRAGLIRFGVNEQSFLKHGKLYDQILLGLSKPEETPCPQL